MNLLDRHGIKEVADVTFYENLDGTPGKPVLYLDTLKISTSEQTAEAAEARGGKGNTALLAWDYGKEVTLNLEDALFSRRSLETIFGGEMKRSANKIVKTKNYTIKNGTTYPFFTYNSETKKWYFNAEHATDFGLPWIRIADTGEEPVLTEQKEIPFSFTQSWSGSIIPDIAGGEMEPISERTFYKDIDTGISSEIPLESHVVRFTSKALLGEQTSELRSGGKTHVIRVVWKGRPVQKPGTNDYFAIMAGYYSLSYLQPVAYEGFQITEAGRTLRGEGYLIFGGIQLPLSLNGFSGVLLDYANLTPYEDMEIYLPGFYPIQFELTENGVAEALFDEIEITANTFPGVYYVTADTYSRNELTGEDEFFQLIIPKVKVLSETNTITMEADGDPTVFSMSLKALQAKNQPLMRLIKYNTNNLTAQEKISSIMIEGQTGNTAQAEMQGDPMYPFSCEGVLTDIPEGVENLEITILGSSLSSPNGKPIMGRVTSAKVEDGVVVVSGWTGTENEFVRIIVRYKYNYFV